MNFKFHHVNLCSDKLPQLSAFYRNLFNMGAVGGSGHVRTNDKGPSSAYSGKVDFVTDGAIEFHLSERDLNTGFKMKQNSTRWRKATFVSARITSKPSCVALMRWVSRIGTTVSGLMADWHQIFLQDPDGNIVEVHQTGMR